MKNCPLCGQSLFEDEKGTIPLWVVTWDGDDEIPAFTSSFHHQDQAQAEFNSVKHALQHRAKWAVNERQHRLRLEDGERVAWDDLFGPVGISRWE